MTEHAQAPAGETGERCPVAFLVSDPDLYGKGRVY